MTSEAGWPTRKFASKEERDEAIRQAREMGERGMRQVDIARALGLDPRFVRWHLMLAEKRAARTRAKSDKDRILRQDLRVTFECEICGDPHNISVEAYKKRLRRGTRQRCRRCSHPSNAAFAEKRSASPACELTEEQLREWAAGVLASWSPHERALFAANFVVPDDSRAEAARHNDPRRQPYSLTDEIEEMAHWLYGKDMRPPGERVA